MNIPRNNRAASTTKKIISNDENYALNYDINFNSNNLRSNPPPYKQTVISHFLYGNGRCSTQGIRGSLQGMVRKPSAPFYLEQK